MMASRGSVGARRRTWGVVYTSSVIPPSTIVDEMSDVKTMSMVVSRCSKPNASRLRSGLAGRCVFVEVVVPVCAAAERLVLALAAPAEVEVFT